ncbi:MAG: hypothetical protein ACLQPH_04305 [Acidimicrobiales bacterium]
MATKNAGTPLREFVYLDEVSVYSLMASRLGPIAAEFTETESSSLRGEVGTSIQAGVPIAKGSINSTLNSSHTRGSQVVRKSIVQTTFKEFLDYERPHLALAPMSPDATVPEIASGDLSKCAASQSSGWILDPTTLRRGQLIETDVVLEAESIFRLSAVIAAMLDIAQDSQEWLRAENTSQIGQFQAINRVIENLLVGLVPLRGRAVDYQIVRDNDREWIVHHRILDQLVPPIAETAEPLYIVGVSEESLYWKDIRRVLFAESPYRILARISRRGLNETWNPVKLVDILREVVPEMADTIDTFGRIDIKHLRNPLRTELAVSSGQIAFESALVRYASALAQHHGKEIDESRLAENECFRFEIHDDIETVEGRRRIFARVTREIATSIEIERDPIVELQLRTEALSEAGFSPEGQFSVDKPSSNLGAVKGSDEHLLDTEFIAIYW